MAIERMDPVPDDGKSKSLHDSSREALDSNLFRWEQVDWGGEVARYTVFSLSLWIVYEFFLKSIYTYHIDFLNSVTLETNLKRQWHEILNSVIFKLLLAFGKL